MLAEANRRQKVETPRTRFQPLYRKVKIRFQLKLLLTTLFWHVLPHPLGLIIEISMIKTRGWGKTWQRRVIRRSLGWSCIFTYLYSVWAPVCSISSFCLWSFYLTQQWPRPRITIIRGNVFVYLTGQKNIIFLQFRFKQKISHIFKARARSTLAIPLPLRHSTNCCLLSLQQYIDIKVL